MPISDYTTPNSVRSVLGVFDEELEDAVITDVVYDAQLDEAVYEMNATLADTYATIDALTTKTAQQARFLKLVDLWAAYRVALMLIPSLPMFAPKQMQSDKDQQTRVDDPYASLAQSIDDMVNSLEEKILDLLEILDPTQVAPTAVVRVMSVVSGIATDPVTG